MNQMLIKRGFKAAYNSLEGYQEFRKSVGLKTSSEYKIKYDENNLLFGDYVLTLN